ncbi:hypothetical protein [Erwinia sp. OPT-41]|uniref:Bacteriophage protein n=1 Tax=Erwinia plantamica TaxID=3237104 RepID=A0ABW7CL65_9GAMM
MKTKIFAVKFDAEKLIEMSDRAVFVITVNKEVIGYVAKNETGLERIFTPFTADGELSESHCIACAAEELFAHYSGLPREAFNAADTEEEPNPIASLLIAALAAHNRVTRH